MIDDCNKSRNRSANVLFFALALSVLVLSVYWPAAWFGFIEFDDGLYLINNQHLRLGLSPEGIKWAFTSFYTTNWHPLTWLFLLAEHRFFGLSPAGYHLVGVSLHIMNVILLFFIMLKVTGGKWRAAVVSALFAVHPLNIESVVWIAELKNLLSTLFLFMTVLAYLRYAENPRLAIYLAALAFFALGLMSKPMLVSLPFLLLLIDYWPLYRLFPPHRAAQEKRAARKELSRLVIEKIPFFILSLLSIMLTIHAAHVGGAIKPLSLFPFYGRIANAVLSYVSYVFMLVWPFDLAIFYPYSPPLPLWKTAFALLFLSATSLALLAMGRKYRYLTVGWLWYLITLLPVIGIVQVGFQQMANRYMYIPSIGIIVIFVMAVPDIMTRKFPGMKQFLPVIAALPVISFTIIAAFELPHWQNGETAFIRALEVTKNNHPALAGLGNIYQKRGEIRAAEEKFREALKVKPDSAEVHNNLAVLLMNSNRAKEAEFHLREAIKYVPYAAKAHNNLGSLLAAEGKLQEARLCFEKALALKPDYQDARANLSRLMERLPTNIGNSAHP